MVVTNIKLFVLFIIYMLKSLVKKRLFSLFLFYKQVTHLDAEISPLDVVFNSIALLRKISFLEFYYYL